MAEWFTVEKIDAETYAISEYGHWEKVRSFLLIGQERALLIDAGLGVGSIKDVVTSLTDKPVTVGLTHVHWDHIGGLKDFETILVHPADQNWLEEGIPVWSTETVRTEIETGLSQPIPKGADLKGFQLFKGKPTAHLMDQDVIDIGGRRILAIHTPGHSPGHLSFFDQREGYLFPGDLLYSNETPIYANYPSTSPEELVNSLEKLFNLVGVTRIFGSHNQLELPLNALIDLKAFTTSLRKSNLTRHGTGLHRSAHFTFLF